MEEMILNLILANPKAMGFVTLVGALKLVVGPFCDAVIWYIGQTPGQEDDQWLAEVRESKWFKALAYIVNLLFSVKIPEVKK
jgi:hypothetical protein